MFCQMFLAAVLAVSAPPQKFIVLSEFQVWADAAGPEVFEELNRQYIEDGRSHVFNIYPHYENFVWEFPRMKKWVDEAAMDDGKGNYRVCCQELTAE